MENNSVLEIFEQGLKKYSLRNISDLERNLKDLHESAFKYLIEYIAYEDKSMGERCIDRHYSAMSDFYSLAAVLSNLKNDHNRKEFHLHLASEFDK